MNLIDQLEFYGSYHNNRWNQLIHLIFVPTLWASAAVWLCYTGPMFEWPTAIASLLTSFETSSYIPQFVLENLVPNAAFILFICYKMFYLFLDPFGSALANTMLFFCYVGANYFYTLFGPDLAWKYALGIHIFAWYMQIHPGHGILEDRKPALMDSFFQSLFLAPLFVSYEVLFFFGFRPKLYHELQKRVKHNIVEYRREQAKLLRNKHKAA